MTVRFSVALRNEWFQQLEQLKRDTGLSRSKVVEAAVAYAMLNKKSFVEFARGFAERKLPMPLQVVI